MATKKQIIAALECRYDYHSARVVAKEALDVAGLSDTTQFETKEINRLIKALETIGDRLDDAVTALRDLTASPTAAPKASRPPAPTKTVPEPVKEEAPAPSPAPAKTDPKPAAEKPAAKKPAAKKPAAKKPAAEKPAAKKPAAKKPAAKKPAAKKKK